LLQQFIFRRAGGIGSPELKGEFRMRASRMASFLAACFAAACSSSSGSSDPVVGRPPAPGDLVATASSTTAVHLTWTASADPAGFKLERSPDGSTGWTAAATPGGRLRAWDDRQLNPSTTYFYRLAATAEGGDSGWSNVASVTTASENSRPAAPTDLQAVSRGSEAIGLSWTDNAGDETGFEISRSDNGATAWEPMGSVAADVTSWEDTGLFPGTTYHYRVRAVNAAGESDWSDSATATTLIEPPAAPTALAAAATSTAAIHLTWTDNSSTEVGFEVERSPDGSSNWTGMATLAADAVALDDTGLSSGTGYWYRVRAVNDAGPSDWSNAASARTLLPAPVANAGPTSPTTVLLRWTDSNANVTGYEIQRSADGIGGWTQVATPASQASAWEDAGLPPVTESWYRVRAVTASDVSDWSVASATTPAAAPTATRELYAVSPSTNTLTVYDASASGDVAPLRVLGAQTGLAAPRAIAVDTVHGEIFVANYAGDSITVYAQFADGNVAPIRTITGLFYPAAVVVDPAHDELFVSGPNQVRVFARDASGNVAPLRTIEGSSTALDNINGMTYDATHDELVVLNYSDITVYPRSASGNLAPLRRLGGPATRMSMHLGAFVDEVHDELVVANYATRTINFYARDADGDTAPLRSFTAIDAVSMPYLAAVDVANDEVVVAFGSGAVGVYPRTASGDVAATRLITGLGAPTGLAVVNGEYYVVDYDRKSVGVFDRLATGSASPERSIASTDTGLRSPGAVAVDVEAGEIFVGNSGDGAVLVYRRDAFGECVPVRRIDRALSYVAGLAVDHAHGELFVSGQQEIRVFPLTANGSVAPLRVISGAASGLNEPKALAYDAVNGELWAGNTSSVMNVFDRLATGDVAPKRSVGGFGYPLQAAVDPVANEVYVANGNPYNVYVFIRTLSGPLTATRNLSGGSTGLSFPNAVALDLAAGELFVNNMESNAITVYAMSADGNAAPTRTISGAATRLADSAAMALGVWP
jgi:6-phosphogluconolactonase (cycloisomerase 2 family)